VKSCIRCGQPAEGDQCSCGQAHTWRGIPPWKKAAILIPSGSAVALVIGAIAFAPSPPPEPTIAEAPKVETAEERSDRWRVNCLSGWDGSVRTMTDLLEDQILNDPDSYQHISTRTTAPDARGYRQGVTEFRARNGFGGMMRSSVTFTFDDKTCTIMGWQLAQ
jgi:hypothetical protein